MHYTMKLEIGVKRLNVHELAIIVASINLTS